MVLELERIKNEEAFAMVRSPLVVKVSGVLPENRSCAAPTLVPMVRELQVAVTSRVTVCVLKIITSSAGPGTPVGVQIAGLLQFPLVFETFT